MRISDWSSDVFSSDLLGMVYMALIARITRASMLEVLSEDYIRTARAKGVGTSSVLLRHALKNAAVPIVTVIGIGLAALRSEERRVGKECFSTGRISVAQDHYKKKTQTTKTQTT